ncbi:hypothetical protein SNEBB_002816 [Seison nebaliae]|nr:hypothetical protein SNEBB_002816 [Seison nebaliae]
MNEKRIKINIDNLFADYEIDGVEGIAVGIEKEIEDSKNKLRLLVGERYHKIIETSDKMEECVDLVWESLKHLMEMSTTYEMLSSSECVKGYDRWLTLTTKNDQKSRQKKNDDELMFIKISNDFIKHFLQLIYSSINSKNFLISIEFYLIARHIYIQLTIRKESYEKKMKENEDYEMLNHFTNDSILIYQKTIVQVKNSFLSKECWRYLVGEKRYCQSKLTDSIITLMILKNMKKRKLIEIYLEIKFLIIKRMIKMRLEEGKMIRIEEKKMNEEIEEENSNLNELVEEITDNYWKNNRIFIFSLIINELCDSLKTVDHINQIDDSHGNLKELLGKIKNDHFLLNNTIGINSHIYSHNLFQSIYRHNPQSIINGRRIILENFQKFLEDSSFDSFNISKWLNDVLSLLIDNIDGMLGKIESFEELSIINFQIYFMIKKNNGKNELLWKFYKEKFLEKFQERFRLLVRNEYDEMTNEIFGTVTDFRELFKELNDQKNSVANENCLSIIWLKYSSILVDYESAKCLDKKSPINEKYLTIFPSLLWQFHRMNVSEGSFERKEIQIPSKVYEKIIGKHRLKEGESSKYFSSNELETNEIKKRSSKNILFAQLPSIWKRLLLRVENKMNNLIYRLQSSILVLFGKIDETMNELSVERNEYEIINFISNIWTSIVYGILRMEFQIFFEKFCSKFFDDFTEFHSLEQLSFIQFYLNLFDERIIDIFNNCRCLKSFMNLLNERRSVIDNKYFTSFQLSQLDISQSKSIYGIDLIELHENWKKLKNEFISKGKGNFKRISGNLIDDQLILMNEELLKLELSNDTSKWISLILRWNETIINDDNENEDGEENKTSELKISIPYNLSLPWFHSLFSLSQMINSQILYSIPSSFYLEEIKKQFISKIIIPTFQNILLNSYQIIMLLMRNEKNLEKKKSNNNFPLVPTIEKRLIQHWFDLLYLQKLFCLKKNEEIKELMKFFENGMQIDDYRKLKKKLEDNSTINKYLDKSLFIDENDLVFINEQDSLIFFIDPLDMNIMLQDISLNIDRLFDSTINLFSIFNENSWNNLLQSHRFTSSNTLIKIDDTKLISSSPWPLPVTMKCDATNKVLTDYAIHVNTTLDNISHRYGYHSHQFYPYLFVNIPGRISSTTTLSSSLNIYDLEKKLKVKDEIDTTHSTNINDNKKESEADSFYHKIISAFN